MPAPVIRQFLSGVATDAPVTLTTASTTQGGWWLLALQQWDWDPADEQLPPAGTTPAAAWTLVADTGPANDQQSHMKAWLRRVTGAGPQTVTFTNGQDSDDNHARLWVLSGLRSTSPVLPAAVSSPDGAANLIAPSVDNPDGPTLLIAAWLSGWAVCDITPPAELTPDPELDAVYSTTLSATRTLTTTGATGDLTATASIPDTTWAAMTLLVRGEESVPPPPPGALAAPSRWARALTTTADTALTLPAGTGQQTTRFQFDLIAATTGQPLGQLHPLQDPAPELTHDTARTITRDLKLHFGAEDTARIDPIAHRIAVTMHHGGVSYPLGRYLIVDHTCTRTTRGLLAATALVDEMFLVDQPTDTSFSPVAQFGFVEPTVNIDQAIRLLLRDLPIQVHVAPTALRTAGTWPAGTSRAKILNDLALDGGYATPSFDHHGTLRLITATGLTTQVPDIDLDTPPRVLAGSIAEVTDLLTAPNRIVVISNEPATTPIVGVYDLPPSAPQSAQRRGFTVTHVEERQLVDEQQATQVAQAIAQTRSVTDRAELSTPPDPRHDVHTIVWWRGTRWVETGWSLTLTPGSAMRHILKRIYP